MFRYFDIIYILSFVFAMIQIRIIIFENVQQWIKIINMVGLAMGLISIGMRFEKLLNYY